jgi:hypothetical protein
MKLKIPSFACSRWFLLVSGLVLGVLIVLGIRFFSYAPEHTHYHANFAVYINGKREEFKDPKYYQEVNICSLSTGITSPQQRAHMHEEVNSVVHVHDKAVTWGQFFENIGWTLGPDFIATDNGTIFKDDGTNKLNLILNGQDYTGLSSVWTLVIKDEDRLLVSYGAIDQNILQEEFKSVPATAHEHDISKDPASCAGDEQPTISERLKHLF